MRNILLMALAILLVSMNSNANTVSQQDAQNIAVNFFKIQVPSQRNTTFTPTLNHIQTESDGSVDFYVFDMSPATGFVIVSADDNSVPVIAYSTESYFRYNNGTNGVSDWIKSTAKKINFARVNNTLADARINHLWASYRQGVNPSATRSAAATIGPLLTTIWNQDPYYNSLCPFNTTDNQRCVTGCVATAMAQIMKYWNYPERGVGSFSYSMSPYGNLSASFTDPFNWAAMTNSVSSNTSPVDTLMYKCGVSVAMNYGTNLSGGSGAFVLQSDIGPGNPCAQNSFANYFKYNPNTLQGVYMYAYSSADWISLMESELNAGRVIQYEGYDQSNGGHTWVCDGYDANNFLHMNWGWGGASNGYYSVDNLNAGGYTFNQNDAALIGIEPLYPVSLSVSASSPSICTGASTTLSAHGPASATYTWSPATALSCTTCATPVANPTSTTLYTVTVDSNGVTSSRSIAVIVKPSVVPAFTFSAAASCTLPQNVAFANTSSNGISYHWDFGDGSTSTDINPIHSYRANGDYTARLVATNSCGTDSLVQNQAVHILAGAPTASCQNICPGQEVTLSASGAGSLSWYDAPSQGGLMSTGNTYATPPLSNTITYYVASLITPPIVTAGALNNTIGQGSYNSYSSTAGMVFNSFAAQYLLSVEVYASNAGPRTFLIEDQNRHVYDSVTVNLISGKQTVPLTLAVPAGNNLLLTTVGNPALYYNSTGAAYPYNAVDGSAQITGNNTSTPGAYYYFYNWRLEQPACASPTTPVTVFVLGTNGGSFTASGTGSPTVTFSPADTNATRYAWDFGDGSTSTDVYPTHTYASAGTYTVQLIVSNDTCTDTLRKSFSTVQLGIRDLASLSAFSAFPNPVKDHLGLSLNSEKQYSNCQIKITNILGQNEYITNVDLQSGMNKLGVDITSLAPGIYFVSLQNGKDTVTVKFVKAGE